MRRKELNEVRIREYIAQALLILMKDKPYSAISIGEIAQKAGVNRSSYYRHFETREDIIRFYLSSLMDEAMEQYKKEKDQAFSHYLQCIFTVMYAHKEELLLLHKNGLSNFLHEGLERYFGTFAPKRAAAKDQYLFAYRSGGIYSSLILWIDRGMKETPQELTEIALSLQGDQKLFREVTGQR